MKFAFELEHHTRPMPGEQANGDAVWTGTWLGCPAFAVLDASGHGPEAQHAAQVACAVLDQWDGRPDMQDLAERLHKELRGTRGCALVIALLHDDNLLGFGVGNVQLRALDRSIPAVLTPGVLGSRLRRKVHVFSIPLRSGDRLIATTDGIRGRCDPVTHRGLSPADLCDSLMQDFARPADDATVLVADIVSAHE